MVGRIYIEIRSGLGNQLFQFAFGYILAKEYERELVVCPSYFDGAVKYKLKKMIGKEFRSFRLPFVIKEIVDVISQKKLRKRLDDGELDIIREESTDIVAIRKSLESDRDVFLKGYWQNPQFISDHVPVLQKLYRPTFKLSKECAVLFDRLERRHVGVHIRRGDFLTNTAFGACTIDYYRAAIALVSSTVSNPEFVIFTNDKKWVKENFPSDLPFFVYANDTFRATDIEELFLLAHFKSLIISNSTFSWWGAFLNNVDQKQIICPKTWFMKDQLQEKAHQFIMKDWQVIDNSLELKALRST